MEASIVYQARGKGVFGAQALIALDFIGLMEASPVNTDDADSESNCSN